MRLSTFFYHVLSYAFQSLVLCDVLWSLFSIHYPRDAMLARVIGIATCLSVCPSVRLSVTRWYCVKTKKASDMISSPSDSPKTLVFWRQISSPNSKGVPPNGSLKQSSVGKIQRFSNFKRQYLEKWLIGSRTWAIDWHQDRWPWMTLNSISLNFQWISPDFADFGRNNS